MTLKFIFIFIFTDKKGMNDKNITNIHYIFFLRTKHELDKNYYLLSEVLNKLNISLLPVTIEDLKIIDRSNKLHLILLRNDFSSATYFNSIKKNYLGPSMIAGTMKLFDISSFSEMENSVKFQSKNSYRYFQLPQNLKQVAVEIAVEYLKERNDKMDWPGGKRTKLPAMIFDKKYET